MSAKILGRYVVEVILFITWVGLARDGLGETAVLLTTITNPTPASPDFGFAVAAVGTERLLVGATGFDVPGAGAAHLFTTNGVLVKSFFSPTPGEPYFGLAVAALGNDRVVIGAPFDNTDQLYGGAVYIFHTNGTLLTTLTNPAPQFYGGFGISVAAFGTNAVLIGASSMLAGVDTPGSAFLFGASGNLIKAFTNPTPVPRGSFGSALAVVGTDRVLIGASGNTINGALYAGAAYLFHTNGSLLATLPNPTPASYDRFGKAVAAIGTDRVVVTAFGGDTGARVAGSAYIFSTNGSLLLTITNPAPTSGKEIGDAVDVSADHRLLISAAAYYTGAGAAYVYSTNGTLIATVTNPNPTGEDAFGFSLAWVGLDRILVGAYQSGMGAIDSGSAYLFGIPAPSLRIGLTITNTIAVSWPSPSTGWTLQQNASGIRTVNWSNITSGILDNGTTRTFVVSPPSGNRFFRLVNP